MRRKIAWLVVSCLMALSLVLASCAPAAVEEEVEEEVVVEEEEEVTEEEVVAPAVEKPKYGGLLKIGRPVDITDFDDIIGKPHLAYTHMVTNETLVGGDWTKGPAGGYGSYETDWTASGNIVELKTGKLAESWELPTKMEGDKATIIFHIRKGVHYALNPASEASRLVGGREMTTDDVLFSLNQVLTDKRSHLSKSNPELKAAKITSPAPWTVKVEIPWEAYVSAVERLSDYVHVVPPEVVKKYGDMGNWRVSVGTGPFFLTDVVPSSTMTLVRNPNYWMKDPIGPGKGNQLPYLDSVKYIVIPDKSTLYAAMRTAKFDWTGGLRVAIPLEDRDMLLKTTPQLKWVGITPITGTNVMDRAIYLKLDRPPFNDIRVRRALMMATDFEAIQRDLYGGDAQIVTFPITYAPAYADAYYGPDVTKGVWPSDCPESIKELYSYNPEKARALLAEAGYPQGFKANLILESRPEQIDYLSIIVDMWSKVGIDVKLHPKETASYQAIETSMGEMWDSMIATTGGSTDRLYQMTYFHGIDIRNVALIDDPVVNETYEKVQKIALFDTAEANRLHREMMKHMLDQAWVIPAVASYSYTMWWPWIKNYSGEDAVGYVARHFFQYVWIDQELKKSMGY